MSATFGASHHVARFLQLSAVSSYPAPTTRKRAIASKRSSSSIRLWLRPLAWKRRASISRPSIDVIELERIQLGQPQVKFIRDVGQHTRRGRQQSAELRAGSADLHSRFRRSLNLRCARYPSIRRRHSGAARRDLANGKPRWDIGNDSSLTLASVLLSSCASPIASMPTTSTCSTRQATRS